MGNLFSMPSEGTIFLAITQPCSLHLSMIADKGFRVQQCKDIFDHNAAKAEWQVCFCSFVLRSIAMKYSEVFVYICSWKCRSTLIIIIDIFLISCFETRGQFGQYGSTRPFECSETRWYHQHGAFDHASGGGVQVFAKGLASKLWNALQFCGMRVALAVHNYILSPSILMKCILFAKCDAAL